ncbi:MAG: nitrate reductase [Gammaproteobacteria bacterium]|nr:MAG: nitrate reductase [Gammaproteobacteria bacterium]
MLRHLYHSLMFRLGLMMAAIILLAVLAASSSLMMANRIKGEAQSVNLAGLLRLQSYRIAAQLVYDNSIDQTRYRNDLAELITDFERQLASPALTAVAHAGRNSDLEAAYGLVVARWRDEINPMLDMYLSGLANADDPISEGAQTVIRARYLDNVPAFVGIIDDFTGLLARDAENKIHRLQLYQYSILAATLLLALLTLYLTYRKMRVPLQALLQMASSAGQGDFSGRTRYQGKDELGQLGAAFNLMSTDLERLYGDLEEEVRNKTADLERGRRSIELLYRTVNRLQGTSERPVDYRGLLTDVEELADTGPGTICLCDDVDMGAVMLASTFDKNYRGDGCGFDDCARCLRHENAEMVTFDELGEDGLPMIAVPIRDHSLHYGVLLIQLPEGQSPEPWKKRLLETVANHIGIALTMSRQATERRRLALLEERSVIARELHDSLAQALAYLKIQVVRLEKNLQSPQDSESTRAIIVEIRQVLTAAHRELRELLSTFRLRMDRQDLATVLATTKEEFDGRNAVDIRLDYRLRHSELDANEEIHLVQIVREALTNVINHSGAKHCSIRLESLDNQDLQLTIEDDGKGFTETSERQFHYGLTIMRERANILGCELECGVSRMGGARVRVCFTPECRRSGITRSDRGRA